MKKIFIIIALVLFSLDGFAQYKEQWRAIHAYEIPMTTGFFGMNFTAEYFPLNYFSIVPSYTIFLPATGKASGFDVNFRYYLTEKEKQWYGLLGYGYYLRRFEFNPEGRRRTNSLNIGAGGMIKFNDELGINPEIRYQPIGRNELLFKLGVVYFIN